MADRRPQEINPLPGDRSRSVTPALSSPGHDNTSNENVSRYMDLRPRPNDPTRSSVRIRRLPSYLQQDLQQQDGGESSATTTGRKGSNSDPSQKGVLTVDGKVQAMRMPAVKEEGSGQPQEGSLVLPVVNMEGREFDDGESTTTAPAQIALDEYESDLVDVLDVVDPEVSTLSTLTNLQNSMFVPNLGSFINRRPIYNLTPTPTNPLSLPMVNVRALQRSQTAQTTQTAQRTRTRDSTADAETEDADVDAERRPGLTHTSTIDSTMSESRYAVLPHGRNLEGWTAGEKDELNDHVRHMLHSRRAGFKRGLRGFGQYVRQPLGFFVTLYATLITLFGLAWVLFLIGWVNVGGKQSYTINVIDNVLVALFAIMGDGLIPFRTWDTYNMIFIAHYHHLTWKLRRKAALPKLENKNDLPPAREDEVGLEESKQGYYSVLTPKQQETLLLHQSRFCRSHTFYKPHETMTHFAFPIKYLIAIVTLLDFHSVFQIALGTCTWAIPYKKRPFALTTVILCCSIACNVTGGILISVGDHKTRKKEVLKKMFRQELTAEAIDIIEKRRQKDQEHSGDSDNGAPASETQAEEEKNGKKVGTDFGFHGRGDQDAAGAKAAVRAFGALASKKLGIQDKDFASEDAAKKPRDADHESSSTAADSSARSAAKDKAKMSDTESHTNFSPSGLLEPVIEPLERHKAEQSETVLETVQKEHKAMELTEVPQSPKTKPQT